MENTKYRIKNLTYQPLRVLTRNGEVIVRSRDKKGEASVDIFTDQMKNLEKKGFIKITEVREQKKTTKKKTTTYTKPEEKTPEKTFAPKDSE